MDTDDKGPVRERTDILMRDRTLAGKYRLGRLIGEGGMGAVYEAVHTKLGVRVAVKLMNANIAQSQKAVTRFRREAKAMAAIRHPNVVAVMDADTDEDGAPYLVMEFLDGESLSSVLARERKLPPEIAAGIAVQVLAGLYVAHEQGVVHRDLKPPNLFVCQEQDGNLRIKILDFGISKFAADTSTDGLTIEGGLVGTPQYMSPEQARGDADVDRRADIYGVGVLLYRMTTGRHPFRKKPTEGLYDDIIDGHPTAPRVVAPDVPPALERVILTAMANRREDRYQDARAMRAAIFDAVPSLPRESMLPASGSTQSPLTGPSVAQVRASSSRSTTEEQEDELAATLKASRESEDYSQTPHSTVTQPSKLPRVAMIAAAVLGLVGIVVTLYHATRPVPSKREPAENVAVEGDPLRFGLMRYLPLEQVLSRHQPLADYLAQQIGRPVELVVVEDYDDLAGQVASGEVDLAALSPYSYVQAKAQAPDLQLLATPVTAGGHSSYQGYIITRAELPIRTLEDLRDRDFCFVSTSSTSGYLYPRALLRRAGLDPDADFRSVRITGDHIASLRALHAGACDAAAIYANAYHDVDQQGMSRDEFRVVATTDPIPYDAYVAAPTLDASLAESIRQHLLSIEAGTDLSREVMGAHTELEGFTVASDSIYDPVREIEPSQPETHP